MVWGTLCEQPYMIMRSRLSQNVPSHRLMHGCERFCVWVSGNFSFRFMFPPRAACDEMVRLTRILAGERATGFVNGVMRRLAREKPALPEDEDTADALACGLPKELYRLLMTWYGREQAKLLGTWSKSSPTSLSIRPDMRRPDHFKKWMTGEEAPLGIRNACSGRTTPML